MKFLEKNLEDIIFETPNEKLQNRGLDIYGHKRRQVKIGNYGIADLITFEKPQYEKSLFDESIGHWEDNKITIYELKQKEINFGSFNQALRYYRGIERYLESYRILTKETRIEICLIGESIDLNSSFSYLDSFSDKIKIFTYKYDFDGITFEHRFNFSLVNEGF